MSGAQSPVDPRVARTLEAYDRGAQAYQERWRTHRPLDAIRRFAGRVGRGGRVLDVAAGPALDLRLLRDAGLTVVAGDISIESLRLARTLFPKGCIAQWDYRRLPFADGVFDGIWASAALQHVPRSQVRAVLAEWRRVQRRGPIFVSLQEGTGDLEPLDEPAIGTVHATTVTADELRALLRAAGYVEVEVDVRPDLLGRTDVSWVQGFGMLRP